MSEWTSVSVKQETRERLNRMKERVAEEQDAPEQSHDLFLNGLMDTWEAAEDGYYDDSSESDADLTEMQETLEEIRERMMELDIASQNKRVLSKMKDMETELKTHFERELGR